MTRRVMLSPCPAGTPVKDVGPVLSSEMITHWGGEGNSLFFCLNSVLPCWPNSRLSRAIPVFLRQFCYTSGGRVLNSDGAKHPVWGVSVSFGPPEWGTQKDAALTLESLIALYNWSSFPLGKIATWSKKNPSDWEWMTAPFSPSVLAWDLHFKWSLINSKIMTLTAPSRSLPGCVSRRSIPNRRS